jgi:hypothetical protein
VKYTRLRWVGNAAGREREGTHTEFRRGNLFEKDKEGDSRIIVDGKKRKIF